MGDFIEPIPEDWSAALNIITIEGTSQITPASYPQLSLVKVETEGIGVLVCILCIRRIKIKLCVRNVACSMVYFCMLICCVA